MVDYQSLSSSHLGLINKNDNKNIFSLEDDENYDDGREEEETSSSNNGDGGVINSRFKFKDINDSDSDGGDLIFSNDGIINRNSDNENLKDPPKGIKGILFYLCLSSYWLASSAIMGGLISLVWPSQIAKLGGEDNKAKYVGLLPILGAITSIIIGPISGFLSDNCTHKFGKRRIFIFSGSIVALISLFLTGTATNIYAFMLFLMGIQFGIVWGTTPFSGLLPDIMPKSKYGIASGYLAFSNAIGQLVGVIGTALIIHFTDSFIITYSFLIIVLVLATIPTLIHIKETPLSPIHVQKLTIKRFIYSFYLPKDVYKNFYWVIITRFMQEMGVYSILPFFSYYLTDIIHVQQEDREIYTSMILSLIILTSVPSGIAGGPLSDKYGRKLLVYISCGIMTLVTCGFIVLSKYPSLKLVMLFSGLFGLGYGCYQGVDYALALDVLPPDNVAKDLSIWHQALVIPQVIAPAISGLVINAFKDTSLVIGYTIAFSIAVVWFLLSTIMIKPIKLNNNNRNSNNFIKLTPTSIDL